MRSLIASLCLAGVLAGCTAVTPPPDTPALPPDVYGMRVDNDVGAINFGAWAFGSPERLRNDPLSAAKAVIAVEYLAGELSSAPRWAGMPPLIRDDMLRARAETRQALGIQPDAPSQLVVNGLLGLVQGLETHSRAAAETALATPVFSLGPDRTMQRLEALPLVRTAQVAMIEASQHEHPAD